ncbi:E3 ISG15--protein ligase HERC5-like [Pholidichthys leucotaenia]
MFSWGEDCQRGFYIKEESNNVSRTGDGVHYLNLGYHVSDLSAGHNVLAFVKNNGNAFIIRINDSKDGRRVRGKQKFVECKEKTVAVSCGDDVVAFLSERGSLCYVDLAQPPCTPRSLEGFSKPVSQVGCGSQHSVILTTDGQVFAWGKDSRGQLGLGKRKAISNSPQHVISLSNIPVVQIAAGGEQSFALSVSGGVFSWGRNDCGQLGLGDTQDRHTPTSVHCLNMKKTVHISCGKDHTAILTKHGAVFTFGSGQHGQLGHNSSQNELHPRLVAELWGAKVTKVSCGRYHTLVMTDTNRVYSCGCGDQGQLGRGEETHSSVPLPVQLPQEANECKIKTIFAGGNCSFASCSFNKDVQAHTGNDHVSNITQHSLDGMIDKWTTECDSRSWKKLKPEINKMFSSASCLNQSFLDKRRDKHFQTSPNYPGLDLKLARLAFRKLVKKDHVQAEVKAAVLHLLPSLNKNPVGVEGLRIYLLLSELLHVMQKHTADESTKLEQAVATAVTNLSTQSLQTIGDWWCSLSHSTMRRYVNVWKKALSLILSYDPVSPNSGVRNLLQVFQYMYNANCRIAESQRMPDSDFCLLFDDKFLCEDLDRWRLWSKWKGTFFMPDKPLILGNFPIVMDLQTKKRVFDINMEYNQFMEWKNVFRRILCGFQFFPEDLVFPLALRRASFLEDTFQKLAAVPHGAYRRPLQVVFVENDYNLDDEELYRKDFFYEVFHEMVSAESGMFMFNDTQTLAWFSSRAKTENQHFFFFGLLCGLALCYKYIIYLPFPLVLFKKLLGVRPSLEDLKEFSPTEGKSLQSLLNEYSDDVLLSLNQDFRIDWDGTDVDLDPDNPEKLVTGQNKQEFVDAYVNHVFNTSVDTMFQEFRRGFFQVCERDLVRLFRPQELQEVLVGKDIHDWETMKKNTVYEGDYHKEHPTIQMFWEVFDELTENQKKAFLWFVTGFDRMPSPLDKIKIQVKVKEVQELSNNENYPTAHTCFSTLELPLYSSKEIMQTRLIEALGKNRRIAQ